MGPLMIHIRLMKMDQKGHIVDQKGLKMYEKAKNRVFGPKIPVFFSSIGGYPNPLPPLTKNPSAQKPLSELGVPPPAPP